MARPVAVYPMKADAAKSMRGLAGKLRTDHPEMDTHQHVLDAARTLERGNVQGATRHLNAAIHGLSPMQLNRHGIQSHDGHQLAKRNMDGVHRHLLLVKDIEDFETRNQQHADRARERLAMAFAAHRGAVHPQPVIAARQPVALAWELSADTARLAATPAPYGKPGGPGLYGVKGQKHSDYFEQVVQAMMRKGKTKEQASAMAYGILRRWARGGGGVHPEVRAAAAAALAEEAGKHGSSHANQSWAVIDLAIEMAVQQQNPSQGHQKQQGGKSQAKSQNAQNQTRVPKGQVGGGQFSKDGGGQGQAGRGQHMHNPLQRHMTAEQRKRAKAQLLQRARSDRQKAHALTLILHALEQQAHARSRSTSRATKAGRTGKTAAPTPAKKTAPSKTPSKAGSGRVSTATLHGKIVAIRAQIASLLSSARMATAQAARL